MIGTILDAHNSPLRESERFTVPVIEIEAVKKAFADRFQSRVMDVECRDWINSASVNQLFREEFVTACICCGETPEYCECTLEKFVAKGYC